MKKKKGIFGKVFSTVALLLVILAAVVIAGPRIIGWQPYQVLSGSMEPTYHVGSVIYVKKADPQSVKVNDPITFYLEDGKTVVTHRVVKIDAQNQRFYTKGDANNVQDGGATPFSRLIGKPMFCIPSMGYAVSYFNTKQGQIIAVTIIFCLMVLAFLPDLLMKIGGNKNGGESGNKSKEG